MTLTATAAADALLARIDEAMRHNGDAVRAAADLLAPVVLGGGVLHAFATGHSQSAAMDFAGRAGGLIPTNRLSLTDLVLRGRQDPSVLDDVLLERSADVAAQLWDLAGFEPGDAVVIFSNSGVNASVVEMARRVADAGLPLVAVTSLEHTDSVVSLHPSGDKLRDLADVVLDNLAPAGDALVEYAPGRRVCGFSTIASCVLVQMLVAEIVGRLQEAGAEPPVYRSANLPGGHEHNLEIERRYTGRLHRVAG
jgi:uncharacterized phosphosugar-binding protein